MFLQKAAKQPSYAGTVDRGSLIWGPVADMTDDPERLDG